MSSSGIAPMTSRRLRITSPTRPSRSRMRSERIARSIIGVNRTTAAWFVLAGLLGLGRWVVGAWILARRPVLESVPLVEVQ